MSWLSNWLNPGRGYEKGQEQLDKYYQQGQGYQQPYNQNGQGQYGNLNEYIQNLMNPEALQSKWAEGYSESPAAKQAEQLAQEHGLNAASSMGLTGSNTALNAIQQGSSQIGLNDRQNYLDNLMQKYMAGAGLSQGIYNTGAQAGGQMGQNAMNMGQNSANMAYGKQSAGSDMFNSALGTAAGAAATYFGGPVGAAAWNTVGGKK